MGNFPNIKASKQFRIPGISGMYWRPIETAPRDNSWVLLFDPRFDLVAMGTYFSDNECDPKGRFKAGDWCLMEWDGLPSFANPTYWMPLPPTPAGRTINQRDFVGILAPVDSN